MAKDNDASNRNPQNGGQNMSQDKKGLSQGRDGASGGRFANDAERTAQNPTGGYNLKSPERTNPDQTTEAGHKVEQVEGSQQNRAPQAGQQDRMGQADKANRRENVAPKG